MVWNTIAHPRMMVGSDEGADGTSRSGADVTSAPYPIKFADPHKMAYFDLIIDKSDADKTVLVHGDYETIKNKILNHEMVISAVIRNKTLNHGTETSVLIMPMEIVPIKCINKDDKYIILVDTNLVLTPENKIIPPEESGVM